MGKFEDLIEAAKGGDTSALDTLEAEFSGSALREKAETAEALKQQLEEQAPLIRKARFDELKAQLPDDLAEVSLSPDDFTDVSPQELSLDLLQARAQREADAVKAREEASAREAGFESVEEYKAAMETLRKQQAERREKIEATGGALSSGDGDGSGGGEEPFVVAQRDYKEAKKLGQTDDEALGEFVHTLMTQQAPKEL